MREAIRGPRRSSEVIRGHQAGLESLEEEAHLMREAIRGHQRSLGRTRVARRGGAPETLREAIKGT